MRLVTFHADGAGEESARPRDWASLRSKIGALVGDVVYDVFECSHIGDRVKRLRRSERFKPPCRMTCVLQLGPEAIAEIEAGIGKVRSAGEDPRAPFSYPLAEIRLSAPVPRPYKLLALAGNYAEHIREGGQEAPGKETTTPRVFMKPPSTTITAPGAPIVIPRNGNHIDYELELAVVMGRHARFVPAEEALDCVGGYTILNDVSERALKIEKPRASREGDRWFDWLNGKWFDTFAPMGPCLTTPDDIPDPQALDMRLRVNGDTRQQANTGQMIFSCAELVAWISTLVTLEPGDVIATGTPAGVGSSTGRFLRSGDVVEAEIEKIGVLRTPVEGERPADA